MKKRQQHTKEFKSEAVRLLEGGARSYREVATMIGVDHGLLRKWKQQLEKDGEDAFRGHGKRKALEAELHLLREEVRRLKEEQEILKKAAAYFARNLK